MPAMNGLDTTKDIVRYTTYKFGHSLDERTRSRDRQLARCHFDRRKGTIFAVVGGSQYAAHASINLRRLSSASLRR